MCSATVALAPIIKALDGCEEYVGGLADDGNWCSVNELQKRFLDRFYMNRDELLSDFAPDELEAWARDTAEELNAILVDHGYDIRLDPWQPGEGRFGVVAIMDVLVNWQKPGKSATIYCSVNERQYAGVKLEQNVSTHSSPIHAEPLLRVVAEDGYDVWMTVAEEPLDGFELLRRIQTIRRSVLSPLEKGPAVFPMISLNQQVNIDWLIGLNAVGLDNATPVIIDQAVQQTRFRMNQFGARAQSAAAVGARRGFGQFPIALINRPFYLWIEKRASQPCGSALPVFAAYLDLDSWADPGSLE